MQRVRVLEIFNFWGMSMKTLSSGLRVPYGRLGGNNADPERTEGTKKTRPSKSARFMHILNSLRPWQHTQSL